MTSKALKYTFPSLVALLWGAMVLGLLPPVAAARADVPVADTVVAEGVGDPAPDSLRRAADGEFGERGLQSGPEGEGEMVAAQGDSLGAVSAAPVADTAARSPFMDDVVNSRARDSMVFYPATRMVYLYGGGEVGYQDNNLKAERIDADMRTREIAAYSVLDTLTGKPIKVEFSQGGQTTTADTARYNMRSRKLKARGGYMQEGEGFIWGQQIKKQPDNSVDMYMGRYSTCDLVADPHFYIQIRKAKLIPGKKVMFNTASLWLEDVPLPLIVPFGFAPIANDRHSGWMMPNYGEVYSKGFFLRDGGYYFSFNDYIDLALTGGFYTLGSWEAAATSRYIVRYKYSGSFDLDYSRDIIGEKDTPDYVSGSNYRIAWTHRQDSKFRPNSNFAASVNYSSSGYSKYGAVNMADRISNQTNSSISYSRSGLLGGKGSFSTNASHSQNSRDSTVYLGLPNFVFNVSNFSPLKWIRGDAPGKERWYEKVTMRYGMEFKNSVTVKERDLFQPVMWDNMKNGVRHNIPISASFPVLRHINISPSVNYNARMYFSRLEKEWDDDRRALVTSDTTYGFYYLHDYSFSMSATTKVYGFFDFPQWSPVQRVRHMMTPTVSFSYTPDFGDPKFGNYREVTAPDGRVLRYSPYEGAAYGYPGSGETAAIRFSLQNTLEAKVRSKSDTMGYRKVKLIDELSASSSYNFLADSLNLANFSLALRIPITKSYSLNLNATLDPYEVDERGRRINKFMMRRGKPGRITSTSWSFDYTFSSKQKAGATGDQPSQARQAEDYDSALTHEDFFADPTRPETMLDPATRRRMMAQQYYDFSVPWTFGFSYSLSYSNNGLTKNITQTANFRGTVAFTPKMGVNFGGGYDFKYKRFTPSTLGFSRDLHCWQMSFSWVPVGFYKSWSFNISVKSSLLKDLKYDRQSSFYDNLRE